jgi:hypothetical protein
MTSAHRRVGRPLRVSLSSIMSSWMRAKAWNSSRDAATVRMVGSCSSQPAWSTRLVALAVRRRCVAGGARPNIVVRQREAVHQLRGHDRQSRKHELPIHFRGGAPHTGHTDALPLLSTRSTAPDRAGRAGRGRDHAFWSADRVVGGDGDRDRGGVGRSCRLPAGRSVGVVLFDLTSAVQSRTNVLSCRCCAVRRVTGPA